MAARRWVFLEAGATQRARAPWGGGRGRVRGREARHLPYLTHDVLVEEEAELAPMAAAASRFGGNQAAAQEKREGEELRGRWSVPELGKAFCIDG